MSNLFKPINVGTAHLSNRNCLAPLTRCRCEPDNTPTPMMVEHYRQRALAYPGTLLIAEATHISSRGGFYAGNTPGVYTAKHIAGWKKIIDAVHEAGSSMFIQIWALGRMADYKATKAHGLELLSASAIPHYGLTGELCETPRALTVQEIKSFVEDFAQGAKNSIEAGADGVELHGAHGYLISQFLDPILNQRTDEYGGSIENRARFLFEVVDATIAAVGAEKVGIRFSPWLNQSWCNYDLSPIPQFSYIFSELERRAHAGNRLAYIHIAEPRVQGAVDATEAEIVGSNEVWVRLLWKGIIIRAGGITPELAEKFTAEDDKTLVAWGRYYTSNPDLPKRIEKKLPLKKYIRKYFYTDQELGYNDFTGLENNL